MMFDLALPVRPTNGQIHDSDSPAVAFVKLPQNQEEQVCDTGSICDHY